MSTQSPGDEQGFAVLSDAAFAKLTQIERLEYLRRAIPALQRLQSQVQQTLKDNPVSGA
jgi:hypothetical protein